MKLIFNSLLYFLLISSLAAQPTEFTPQPCNQNAIGTMFYNFFIGQIGGLPATGGDWVAAIDAQNNLVGVTAVQFFAGGFGCPAAFGTALQIAGEQTSPGNTCPPPPYGGSIGEELTIVVYRASDGAFFTIPVTVPFVSGASGASTGNCFTLNFTEPFTFNPPTPVQLLSFRAKPNAQRGVQLDWVTATEQNSSHFEVQHSLDGNHWTNIGRLAAAGNSDYRIAYTFEHQQPQAGQNLYRLRQVDFDGTFYFSPVAATQIEGGKGPRSVAVFPNPSVGSVLNIAVEGEWSTSAQTTLYDLHGRQVATWTGLVAGRNSLSLPALPQGVYQLVSQDQSFVVSQRIVVQ